MIKHIASCPYCRRGEIAFDCETMELVINPDEGNHEACEHLICLNGFYACARVFHDGRRKVGFANVNWQHPGLPALPPDEVYRRLQQQAAAAGDGPLPPSEQPYHVGPVCWELEQSLSQAETARWLDQVGWDKAEVREAPCLEAQLNVWVGFARGPAELLPALEQQPKTAAP
jgi:hypothetical protein